MKKTLIAKTALSAIFALISLKLFLGVVSGYFISRFYIDKVLGKKIGKLTFSSVYVPFGKYKIHMHHWLYPSLILGGGALSDAFFLAFYFPVGVLLGIALHDIATDKHWYRVVIHK